MEPSDCKAQVAVMMLRTYLKNVFGTQLDQINNTNFVRILGLSINVISKNKRH